MNKELDTDMFDVESIKKDIEAEKAEPESTMPPYGSAEWNEYIMGKFEDSELIDGNPLTHGLRRVAEEVLGDIVSSRPVQIFASDDANGPGRATVVYEIVINWMCSGQLRTYGEVADVWHGNTDDLFCAHPVATASTRAEGRALRKALKLRCVAAEELVRKKDVESIVRQSVSYEPVSGEWKGNDSISDPQINFIDGKCRQLNFNVMTFINSGSKKYDKIESVNKKEGSDFIKKLNEFQTQKLDIPEEIKGYDPDWR